MRGSPHVIGVTEGCPGSIPTLCLPRPPAQHTMGWHSGMVGPVGQAPKSDMSLFSLLVRPQRTRHSARWSSPTDCVNGSSSSSSAAARASWSGRGAGPCWPSGRLSTCLQTAGQILFWSGALPDSFTPSRSQALRRHLGAPRPGGWASRSSSSQMRWLAALFWQTPPRNQVHSGNPQLQLPSSLWDHTFTEASRPKQTVKTLGLIHRSSPCFLQLRSQSQPPGPAHRTWLSPRVMKGRTAHQLVAHHRAGWGVVWSDCKLGRSGDIKCATTGDRASIPTQSATSEIAGFESQIPDLDGESLSLL